MTVKRLALVEMEQRYPDQWLLIIDCELSENTELLSGKVVSHGKSRKDIREVSAHYKGQVGTHYTGKIPDDTIYVF